MTQLLRRTLFLLIALCCALALLYFGLAAKAAVKAHRMSPDDYAEWVDICRDPRMDCRTDAVDFLRPAGIFLLIAIVIYLASRRVRSNARSGDRRSTIDC